MWFFDNKINIGNISDYFTNFSFFVLFTAFQELSKRQEEIAVEREEIDKKKKLLAKRKPSDSNGPGSRKRSNANSANTANNSTAGAAGSTTTTGGAPNSSTSGVASGSDSPGGSAYPKAGDANRYVYSTYFLNN